MKLPPFPGELVRYLVERPFTTKTGRQGFQHVYAVVLTPEQRQWLATNYPEHENDKLMKASGLRHSTLHRYAREMHLQKSAEGHHRIMIRQGQKAKRTCEKNGYYASIRGRKPSEQCRAASRQMWQDIRDGKREHPVLKMKREHPRKYRNLIKRRGEARRELFRKELLRDTYGLTRQTHLRLVHQPMTTSQVNHRYNAVKKYNYIVLDLRDPGSEPSDHWLIYYDNDTRRSTRFERNLLRDGFKVLPWEE